MMAVPTSHRLRRAVLALASTLLLGATAPPGDAVRFAPWIDGAAADEPEMQVQAIDADTFVIRQSVRTNFEAPFLYLLFGKDEALLIDSGAGGLRIRPTIEGLIDRWRRKHANRPIRLTIAHSHGHGDHHAGDDEFRDRPATRVVGLAPAEVAAFFGIADWPHGIGRIDLGGRMLHVVPTPGHEPAHVMVYDRRTRLLFSGDMLYPGRLYVPRDKFNTFRESTERLRAFAARHPIAALLGAHIEMTRTPGQDYAMEARTHPAERVLPLPASAIDELGDAVTRMGDTPILDRHADFIVYPVPPRSER